MWPSVCFKEDCARRKRQEDDDDEEEEGSGKCVCVCINNACQANNPWATKLLHHQL